MSAVPPALRFAYEGARADEHAVLHGLAAAYEGLFRLCTSEVNGRPVWRHTLKPDKYIAFNGRRPPLTHMPSRTPSRALTRVRMLHGRSWMAQGEQALGTAVGVLMLPDSRAPTPDASDATWKVTPGWQAAAGLRCLAMSEEEASAWESNSNPWAEAAAADAEIGALSSQLRQMAALVEGAKAGAGLAPLGAPAARDGIGVRPKQQPGDDNILRLSEGRLYVGALDGAKRPSGEGALIFSDGSVHAGLFEAGHACGDGAYYASKGSVHLGTWHHSRRVGDFDVVEPSGSRWTERYSAEGKRVGRKRVGDAADAAAAAALAAARGATGAGGPAVACAHCGCKFHVAHNYMCRRDEPGARLATLHEAAAQ